MVGRPEALIRPSSRDGFSPAVPALLGAMTVWGASYVVTKFALAAAGPVTVLFLRLALAAALMAPFAARRGLRLRDVYKKEFALFGLTGMALHLGFEIVGLEFTSASSAALVIATAPAVTVAFSVVLLGERLSIARWVGVAFSILGVVLVTGGQAATGYPLAWLGNLLVFAGVVTWGVFTVQAKRLSEGYHWLVSTTAATAFAALLVIPFMGTEILLTGVPEFDAGSLAAVVYLGIGASALAYGLWNFALEHVDASVAGPFINLVPVFGVAIALLVGETMTPLQILGGAVVGIGVLLSYERNRSRSPI